MRQKFGDQWSGRDPRRWGDVARLQVPAGALDFTTDQIIQVEAPHPCVWRVQLFVAGFDAGDNATARFALDIGVGSATARAESDAFGGVGLASIEIAAQSIVGRVRLVSANVLAPRSVSVNLWAAPVVPWDGLSMEEVSWQSQSED